MFERLENIAKRPANGKHGVREFDLQIEIRKLLPPTSYLSPDVLGKCGVGYVPMGLPIHRRQKGRNGCLAGRAVAIKGRCVIAIAEEVLVATKTVIHKDRLCGLPTSPWPALAVAGLSALSLMGELRPASRRFVGQLPSAKWTYVAQAIVLLAA